SGGGSRTPVSLVFELKRSRERRHVERSTLVHVASRRSTSSNSHLTNVVPVNSVSRILVRSKSIGGIEPAPNKAPYRRIAAETTCPAFLLAPSRRLGGACAGAS